MSAGGTGRGGAGAQRRAGVAALVPMRHDSERVPGKNYRVFAGRPLFHRIIESLLACELVDVVAVDTDSPDIARGCAEHFPEVVVIERPAHLRAGTVPMNDVLLHDTSLVEAGWYLQTHSTNPLLTTATIARALRTMLEDRGGHDSLFGVTRLHTRLYDAHGRAMNHDPARLVRTQDLPAVFEENSNLYVFTRAGLEKRGSRIGARPILFEIDRAEALDIDDESGWRLAEAVCLEQEHRQLERLERGLAGAGATRSGSARAEVVR